MVHKIRFLIFIIFSAMLIFTGVLHKTNIETNLVKTLLPENSNDVISVADKSSSIIKVVFDSEDLKTEFLNKLDKHSFEVVKYDFSNLLNKYLEHPTNFLSDDTRNLLKQKKYDEVYQRGLEYLYNPAGVQLTTFDRDPYFLFDDFIISNNKSGNTGNFTKIKLKNNDALSPDLSNKKISELVKLQKKLSDKNSKIYLAGTPIHSYYTSKNSALSINIICILSTLMIIFLTWYFFRNLKLLIPVALSISFGMLSGYVATKLWFDNFQIITMVFSTALIGIGIDYSYHYFFAEKINKKFIKNLTLSFLTTIIPFALMYMTGIELLKQMSVFTVFGLTGIYFVVLFIYPCFEKFEPQREIKINLQYYKIFICLIVVLSLFGLLRFKFNDSLTSLYTPSKQLQRAESLFNEVLGENRKDTQFILCKKDAEEEITNELEKNNIEHISQTKLFPSKKRQRENFTLVQNLYKNNLEKFSEYLSKSQINNLKSEKFEPVDFENISEFMLNPETSIVYAFTDKNLDYLKSNNIRVVNFKSDIEQYLKTYREKLLVLMPIVILILMIFLFVFIHSVKILLPSIIGIVTSMLLTCLLMGELNLFSVISAFLVLGFSIDYSVFRSEKEGKTESAVFVSCVTTTFSFLLLSLCGFKLLSSISMILFFGILTSYISGYILFKDYGKIDL